MPWTQDTIDKIYRCIRWCYGFIAALLNVSMQIIKYMFIRVITIFIFYMVSTTTCVSITAYMNVPWFTFLKGPLAHVQLCVLIPESLIEFSLCSFKELFDVALFSSRKSTQIRHFPVTLFGNTTTGDTHLLSEIG